MTKLQITMVLLLLFALTLFSASSCAPEVSQEEYDRVNNELSEIKGQVAALHGKVAEAETRYEELSEDYEALEKQYADRVSEIETIESQYDDLEAEYDALQEQYDTIMAGPAGISEEEVEKAIFELVNQERGNNGLDELTWGKNLDNWARVNSRHMAENSRYEYSEYASFQEVFWAAGYSTLERIANGALLTWRSNSYRYELNIVNNATYGAVGVYKSGDIFYITYMADIFK